MLQALRPLYAALRVRVGWLVVALYGRGRRRAAGSPEQAAYDQVLDSSAERRGPG
jgi:hypothetical protein